MLEKKILSKGKRRLRGLSFQQRLPLLICVLLLSVMAIFGCISYLEVKNSAIKAARERLVSLSEQFGTLFGQSSQTFLTSTRAIGNQGPIKKTYLKDSTGRDSAMIILKRLQQQDTTSVLIELLSPSMEPLLRSEIGFSKRAEKLDTLIGRLSFTSPTGAISKIYLVGDSMFYSATVPVTEGKKLIGHVLRWRRLYTSAKSLNQLYQLIGSSATLYVGNADGSLWTDMTRPITHLTLDSTKHAAPFEYSSASSGRTIAAMKAISSTPWLVSVEFSRSLVLESANRFLRWMVLIGGLLILIATVIAWFMSRNITHPLKELTAAATSIAGGDYSTIVGVDRRDEIGKLARSFNAMIAQLSVARLNLEQKVSETEQINEQLRSLTAYLQNIREEERIHIAREMHDELGQLLTSFKMDVSWLNKNLHTTDKPGIYDKLSSMNVLVDESVSFVRKLAAELRPSILDDFGLIPALSWHSKEFQKRFSIAVEFKADVDNLELPSNAATGLFRIYQESLTNVARHADAKKINSRLIIEDGHVILTIVDDGKGFNYVAKGKRRTLGLLGMNERAAMIGGSLDIQSSPGKGTTVQITVPIDQSVYVPSK
jgi:signal transduction histidine kinase